MAHCSSVHGFVTMPDISRRVGLQPYLTVLVSCFDHTSSYGCCPQSSLGVCLSKSGVCSFCWTVILRFRQLVGLLLAEMKVVRVLAAHHARTSTAPARKLMQGSWFGLPCVWACDFYTIVVQRPDG